MGAGLVVFEESGVSTGTCISEPIFYEISSNGASERLLSMEILKGLGTTAHQGTCINTQDASRKLGQIEPRGEDSD